MADEKMPKETSLIERFKSGGEIELREHRAMVYLPENAVDINILATVYEDGNIHEVSRRMGMEEIRDAFRKADDGYIDDDDTFIITDKGIDFLNAMKER